MSARPRVAILGGGMGGLAAAWRLSEPGWRGRFDRIVVYQRGWRLGGKGASSRGRHGRIEEHGLHIWLGFYENAFRLLRECYAELDRPRTDPASPISTWRDAIEPAPDVGFEDRAGADWRHWLGRFAPNDLDPGEPDGRARQANPLEFALRGLQLVLDVVNSLPEPGAAPPTGRVTLSTADDPPTLTDTLTIGARVVPPAVVLEATRLARRLVGGEGADDRELGEVLGRAQDWLRAGIADDVEQHRTWQLLTLTVALVRGLVVDGVVSDPTRLAALDDEDYLDWIRRHGAAPEAVEGGFLRALYDLVMGYEHGDPTRPRFGAGTAILLAMKMALEYKGAMFWKMRAGMGDVVFAPLYQALRLRGVEFAFFHRVDGLHLSPDRVCVDAVSLGCQAELAPGVERYEPLVRVRDLPCFPDAPRLDQLADPDDIAGHPLESHFCDHPDVRRVVLRRGTDFDVAVLAVPPPMAAVVGTELAEHRPEWREMIANVATVATQGFQVWLRESEAELGWSRPGATVAGYVKPFDTWASMTQLVDAEDWPDGDRPATIAYFCGVLPADWPLPAHLRSGPAYQEHHHRRVRANAIDFLDHHLAHLLPGAADDQGLRWDLLCGRDRERGPAAFASQFWTANVDPSDRYVQSLPGTNRFRLRPDESGYDNLFLAGDWTDSGLNAGCIEAAVLSGLEAANAVLGRDRLHRVEGYLPE